ncbi:MAG: hypothetical protein Q9162_000737 [Coniocarpon cinnabarinum]
MIHFGHKFYWLIPLFSAIVWLGMLLGLLLYWLVDADSVHYNSMDPDQRIAFISDVGASKLKPLFIAGSTTMVVTLDLSLILERWLRHSGRLAPNTTWLEKGLSLVAIVAAIAGAIGIILLSIYDTAHYPKMHDRCLGVFIVGYLISAIAICAEFQRLGVKYRQHITLRFSFWFKLFFIIVEIALAIPFGVFNTKDTHINAGAVLEWVIALIFTGYIFSFMVDLIPALRNHSMQSHYTDRKSISSEFAGKTDSEYYGGHPNTTYQATAEGNRASGYRQAPAHF